MKITRRAENVNSDTQIVHSTVVLKFIVNGGSYFKTKFCGLAKCASGLHVV